jgi:uncharacterized surface protein with fasciclin (FAS1) repeats
VPVTDPPPELDLPDPPTCFKPEVPVTDPPPELDLPDPPIYFKPEVPVTDPPPELDLPDPPTCFKPEVPAMGPPPELGQPGPTIVEVVLAANSEGPFAGQFDTLIAAILVADPIVLNKLSGNGQFTVFGPTDDAFAELDLDPTNIGTLDQDFLTDVLLYHIMRGRLDSEAVINHERLRMCLRDFLWQSGGVLTDNLGRDANIIVVDIEAGNGIIHVIDAVVLPYAP